MLTSQLSSVKVNFDDEVMDIIILCSLLEIWNSLGMVSSNFFPASNTFKFDEVVGVILSEEIRRKIIGNTSINLLNMEIKGR